MMRHAVWCSAVALVVPLLNVVPVCATTISDFSNSYTGVYVNWNAGNTTAAGGQWTHNSVGGASGGAYAIPAVPVVALASEDTLELKFTVAQDNEVPRFNTVVFDSDGTQRVFQFGTDANPLTPGTYTMYRNINLLDPVLGYSGDNAGGTTPGLDVTSIPQYHFQGSFAPAHAALRMDISVDNLAVIRQVPEPSCLTLLGIVAVNGIVCGRRFRRS